MVDPPFNRLEQPVGADGKRVGRDAHGTYGADAFEDVDDIARCRRGVRVRDLHAWLMREFIDPPRAAPQALRDLAPHVDSKSPGATRIDADAREN